MEELIVCSNGTQFWYRNNQLHRDNDLPAIVYFTGTQCWYQNGQLQRDNDLPAAIFSDGAQYWYKNNKLHRDNDLPAMVSLDGAQIWYQNGKIHRDNDLPAHIISEKSSFSDKITYTFIFYSHGKKIYRRECTAEEFKFHSFQESKDSVIFLDLEIEVV